MDNILPYDRNNIIFGWNFSKQDLLDATRTVAPLCINPSIDLTNACNLNCPYCYIEDKNSIRKKRKSNELTYNATNKIIDELAEIGAKTINIVGAGEPTIDEHFKNIVSKISEKNLTTVLFTNGIKFQNKDLAKFCFDNNISIVLKINSFNRQNQDLVAGRKGYFEQRQKALKNLIEIGYNKSTPTRLGIDTILYSGNKNEIPKIHRWCRENNIFPITADFIPTGRTEDGKYSSSFSNNELNAHLRELDPVERMEVFSEIKSIDSEFNISKNSTCSYYGGGICTQILGLYIDIQGQVFPCVSRSQIINKELVGLSFGNILEGGSLKDIWENHPYMKSLRKNFNGGCPYKSELINDER